MCMPGDNIDMDVELITPIAIEKGLRFAIREGGRTVGSASSSRLLRTNSCILHLRAAEGNLSGSVCPIMPRRVRRPPGGEGSEIIFSGGMYVGRKYGPVRQCADRLLPADDPCAQRTASPLPESPMGFRQRAAEGNLSGSVCPIMPRRVRRPQAAKEVRSFSPAACTSEKIPPSPPVCGSPAPGGRSVRAADCEPFAGKPNGLFGSAPLRETSAALFACTQFRPHCIQ